jgi:hypothetical protein
MTTLYRTLECTPYIFGSLNYCSNWTGRIDVQLRITSLDLNLAVYVELRIERRSGDGIWWVGSCESRKVEREFHLDSRRYQIQSDVV